MPGNDSTGHGFPEGSKNSLCEYAGSKDIMQAPLVTFVNAWASKRRDRTNSVTSFEEVKIEVAILFLEGNAGCITREGDG